MRRKRFFDVGERVVMTRAARRRGLQGRAKSPRGVVTAVTWPGLGIRVLRDGLKHPDGWSTAFWRREGAWGSS